MRPPRCLLPGIIVLTTLGSGFPLPAEPLALKLREDRILEVSGVGRSSSTHRLELSIGLEEWWPVFAQRGLREWMTLRPEAQEQREAFFRLTEVEPPVIAPHSSLKSTISLPGDDFFSEPLQGTGGFFGVEIRWVKFALILDALPTVYYQKSASYPFHFNFATERLSPFRGMSLAQFNEVSLEREGQQVVLGAVLWAPGKKEYGIQFVGQDAYPREMLRFLYETVEGSMRGRGGSEGFYMPTFEQTQAAERDEDYLARHGIAVSSTERWLSGSTCYAQGWALGRLKFVPGQEIAEAYESGELLSTDILLTDGVPAEVPFVAGIITTAPSTPNSHVAILAQSYGIPFVYVREPGERARVQILDGEQVALRARTDFCAIQIIALKEMDSEYRAQVLALKEPVPLEIAAVERSGRYYWSDLRGARPADISSLGGKAANFGFLRREIAKFAPAEARALTFDLWLDYLGQRLPGGRTLRQEIDRRLEGMTWPANIAELDARLKGVRDLIRKEVDFTAGQKAEILRGLHGLDPNRRLRFRSSTNVEDSGVFVGAGLYDSYSGCLADDLDDDEIGPSHCDPDQPKERGVYRALRRVFASFYNLNAVIERLRHDVDEREVGMAVLVHYSFPDEFEAANGVITARLRGSSLLAAIVTQVGAESVTNPTGGSVPEVVEWSGSVRRPTQGWLVHQQRSSRLLLGEETVMTWEDDYDELGARCFEVVLAYQALFPELGEFTLEFEFKKLTDGKLVIKQVRRVPAPVGRVAPGLAVLPTCSAMKIFQGEAGTLFGNHRLKSLWQIETEGRWLNPEEPEASVVAAAELRHISDGEVVDREGAPARWPDFRFEAFEEFGRSYAKDSWLLPSEGGLTRYSLLLEMPSRSRISQDPLYRPGDVSVDYRAHYRAGVLGLDFNGRPTTTRMDFVRLVPGSPDDPLPAGSILVERRFTNARRVGITSRFYWPPAPTGPTAGYTAPLEKWVGTTISGLTSRPLVLKNYFSQTYRPGHHNFTEEFLFEPRLEPGLSEDLRDELEARNIRLIYFFTSGGPNDVLRAVGFDGRVRDL